MLSEALLQNAGSTDKPQNWTAGSIAQLLEAEVDDNSLLGATLDKGTPSVFYQLKGKLKDIHYAFQIEKNQATHEKKWSENPLHGLFK